MKTFVVLFALFAAVVAEEWVPKKYDDFKAIRSECLAAHPLSAETLEAMKSLVYPDEEPLRQYLRCFLEKLGIFCEHEGFHIDRIVQQFKLKMDEAKARGIVEKCVDKNEQKSSIDVWIYRCHQCLMKSEIGDGIREFLQNLKKA